MINYCSVLYYFPFPFHLHSSQFMCTSSIRKLAAAATEIEMVMGDDDDEIIFASFSLKKLC